MENQTPTNQSSMVTNEQFITVSYTLPVAQEQINLSDFGFAPMSKYTDLTADQKQEIIWALRDRLIVNIELTDMSYVDNNVRIRQIEIKLKALREELKMQDASKPQFLIDDEDEDEYQAQLELGWGKDELNSQIEKLEEELEFLETAKDEAHLEQ